MKIAVTGATGFVGRHVVAELKRRGVAPVVLTRAQLDVKSPPRDSYRAMGKPDVLIHLAWGGLPNHESLHHLEDEFPAQYRFLKDVLAAGLKNLLVTGTCLEYGMQSGSLHEELLPQPHSPYAMAKHTLRMQLEDLQRARPFNLIWARVFHVYGEGQNAKSVLPQLQSAVERGERTFNMSGGEQLRDFVPVEQVAHDLVSLALSPANVGVVNVCTGTPTSVRALVEAEIQRHGWSITPNLGHFPYPNSEPMAFWGDRRKLDLILSQHAAT